MARPKFSDAAREQGRQRGLGEAAPSRGGSPHSRFAVVSPTRALPWFPPLALGIKTMVLSLAWGHHAIPVYWQLLPKRGNSSLPEQKKVIAPVLRLLRSYPVLLLGL
ncbi:MAG: hypothetical protein F6K55_03990 [Moorea sp. SIO4A3]|nr:hypothetical protein [Moorena sp. SIO4A3]